MEKDYAIFIRADENGYVETKKAILPPSQFWKFLEVLKLRLKEPMEFFPYENVPREYTKDERLLEILIDEQLNGHQKLLEQGIDSTINRKWEKDIPPMYSLVSGDNGYVIPLISQHYFDDLKRLEIEYDVISKSLSD